MLTMPQNSTPLVSIVAFDPGSQMFGVAVLDFNIETLEIVSTEAWTLNAAKLAGKNTWIEELEGNKASRLHALHIALVRLFNYVQPLEIASESPFINQKFPQAGLVLTEVITTIRTAVRQHDVWKVLELIDPPTIKMAVGAPGNANKDVMKEKILSLIPQLNYSGEVPPEQLDEHSIDAIAVAYCRYKTLLEKLCLR